MITPEGIPCERAVCATAPISFSWGPLTFAEAYMGRQHRLIFPIFQPHPAVKQPTLEQNEK